MAEGKKCPSWNIWHPISHEIIVAVWKRAKYLCGIWRWGECSKERCCQIFPKPFSVEKSMQQFIHRTQSIIQTFTKFHILFPQQSEIKYAYFLRKTEMALSLRSCQRARRKARAARWSSGGHQYFPCCLESIRSNTTWRQLHSPSRNSYRLKQCTIRYFQNPDTALLKVKLNTLLCITAQHTFDPSLPSLTSRFRKSSMRPGWVSTATVRNSRIMTLILMSSVLLCSRVRNASRMAAASLPRQA